MVLTIVSKVSGFLRDLTLAYFYGASEAFGFERGTCSYVHPLQHLRRLLHHHHPHLECIPQL